MDKAAVELLICPHCGGDLRENGGSLICSRGHTMNVARQGYVSLLGRDAGTHTADSAEMVAARERFLAGGHFEPLTEAIVSAAGDAPDGPVVDLGCGPGHHLAGVLEASPSRLGVGVDNSKFAARRAARSHPRANAVVADIWDAVPVRDDAAALLLNVFSPRNGEEMERILAPGGRIVVVTPQAGHLAELRATFELISVDPDKEDRLERSLGALAAGANSRSLQWTMRLNPEAVRDLIEMGPNAGRTSKVDMDQLIGGLGPETVVTAAVTITTTQEGM